MMRDTLHAYDRQLKVVAVAVVVISGAVALALTVPVEASVQVHDYSVPDASVESSEVEEITIFFPNAGASWSGTPEPVEEIQFEYYAEGPDGDMQEAGGINCSADAHPTACDFDASSEGSVTFDDGYEMSAISLLTRTDWTADDFSPEPGEEVSHTIEVMVEIEVIWDGGSITESASDTTTLTVINPDDAADPQTTIEFGEGMVEFH